MRIRWPDIFWSESTTGTSINNKHEAKNFTYKYPVYIRFVSSGKRSLLGFRYRFMG